LDQRVRLLAPAAFNAANRSLKSGLTATLSSPVSRLEGHGPHQLETLLRWDPAPELAVERAVVGVEAHHSGRSLATLVTTIHAGAIVQAAAASD
jgi:hypothetical protein